MRAVLDDGESAPFGDRKERVHFAGPPREMHHEQGPCPRSDRALGGSGVEIHRVRIHVREDGAAAGVEDRVRGGAERHRGRDDLVAGGQVQRDARKVKRGRAGVESRPGRHVLVGREVALEARDLRARPEPRLVERVEDLSLLLLSDERLAEHQKAGAGGNIRPGRSHVTPRFRRNAATHLS